MSQLLLFGLLTIKSSQAGAALALIALVYTTYRTYWLRVRYSGLASALPLQRTVQAPPSPHPGTTCRVTAC